MRTAAITALGFLLAAGSAWAQSSYDYSDRDGSRSDSYGSQSYETGRSSQSGGWSDEEERSGKSDPGRGAAFYLKSGDKEFRVKCGDDDSTRECVDAAMIMFRQVQDAQSRTSTSTSYPSVTGSSPSGTSGATSASPTTSGSATSTGSGAGR